MLQKLDKSDNHLLPFQTSDSGAHSHPRNSPTARHLQQCEKLISTEQSTIQSTQEHQDNLQNGFCMSERLCLLGCMFGLSVMMHDWRRSCMTAQPRTLQWEHNVSVTNESEAVSKSWMVLLLLPTLCLYYLLQHFLFVCSAINGLIALKRRGTCQNWLKRKTT